MDTKHRMELSDRAKQFMPFAALKGLPEALQAKEKIRVEKMILSEEMAEELDRKMQYLKKKEIATIVYYSQNEYLQITGMVSKLDKTCRTLQIVHTKILFEDILDITFPASTIE